MHLSYTSIPLDVRVSKGKIKIKKEILEVFKELIKSLSLTQL